MKNLFFVLVLLFSLTFVSADLLQVNNFVYNSNPISNVGVLGFSCTTADCSSGQILFLNSNSGSSSFFDVAYPNSGQNTNYGLFVFKDGYIPYERTSVGYEDISGDKRVDAVNDYLTKKDVCTSTLTNLIVTNNSNVVTIKTNVSAPINHAGGLNFVPSQIASQYSVNVTLLLKINSSVNQTRIVNLPFSGNSEQEFVVTLPSGFHNLEVESFSNDAKCLSSNNQTKTSSISIVNGTVPPVICTSFTYSSWSACVNGQQTRTLLTSSPSGCVGGTPILSQSCTNTDTTAPVLNLRNISINTTNSSGVIVYYFNMNASDDRDGLVDLVCSPQNGSLFAIGSHIVNCNASDSSGNIAHGSFRVNVTLINSTNNQTNGSVFSVNLTSPQNITYNNSVIPLNYSINGTATSCWYVLNGVSVTLTQCANTTISALNGSNNFTLFVSNGTTTINNSVNFTVNLSSVNDTTAPVITIHSPENKTYTIRNIKINVSLNESGSCYYNLNNGANKTFLTSGNYFVADENSLSNGNYALNVFCSDYSGNFANKSVSFKIDVSSDDEDEDDDTDKKKSSGTGYTILAGGNYTTEESLVLNEEKPFPWFGLFLIFLILCILVLFFIVLTLLLRERKEKN
jgi:hypothetical protein